MILAGKRALVKSSVGSIGSAIVRLFAAEGAEVIVHHLPRSDGAAPAPATFIAATCGRRRRCSPTWRAQGRSTSW